MAAGSGLGRKAGPGQFPRKYYPQQRSCKQSSKCGGVHQQPPGPGRHKQALALGHPLGAIPAQKRESPHREGLLKQRDGAPHARGDERNLCGAARLSAAGVAQHRGQRARLARFGRRPGGDGPFRRRLTRRAQAATALPSLDACLRRPRTHRVSRTRTAVWGRLSPPSYRSSYASPTGAPQR